MTIEALPLRGRPRFPGMENPVTKVARAIRKSVTKEKTGGRKEKEEELRSAYLGICLAHENYYGRLSNEAALAKIDSFDEEGINKRQIQRTYSFFVSSKAIFDWFDIGFQISTLQQHLPELLPPELLPNE